MNKVKSFLPNSFNDLQEQMKRYLNRSNINPMAVFGWKSPNQKQRELGGR